MREHANNPRKLRQLSSQHNMANYELLWMAKNPHYKETIDYAVVDATSNVTFTIKDKLTEKQMTYTCIRSAETGLPLRKRVGLYFRFVHGNMWMFGKTSARHNSHYVRRDMSYDTNVWQTSHFI